MPATINTREEALHYIDTVVRPKEQEKASQLSESIAPFGNAQIHEEVEFSGHKAWKFSIEGAPQRLDGGAWWLIDTSDVVRTSISDDNNTPEKAFIKRQETLATLQKQQPGA